MRQLDRLDLSADDVQRIDEIIALKTGQSLAVEAAHWRRLRQRFWMAVSLALFVIVAAGVTLIQLFA